MSDTSLLKLGLNALAGVLLVVWMVLSVGPLLLGFDPFLPAPELAMPAAVAWAIWNARLICGEGA